MPLKENQPASALIVVPDSMYIVNVAKYIESRTLDPDHITRIFCAFGIYCCGFNC